MRARVALLGLIAIATVGCSSSSSGGGTPTPSSSATSPTSSPSGSPTESASASATPTPSFSSTVQASHRCLTAHLRVSLGQAQGAAGSAIAPIVFTNTGSSACTLYGYPGVSFLDENGNQLGPDAAHNGGEEAVVTLAPNGTANAQLQMPDPGNFDPADCAQKTSAKLRVYPPGDFTALTIDEVTEVCTATQHWSSVGPVTPGNGG